MNSLQKMCNNTQSKRREFGDILWNAVCIKNTSYHNYVNLYIKYIKHFALWIKVLNFSIKEYSAQLKLVTKYIKLVEKYKTFHDI